MSLARDALASGDMVTAESYLQHAEHYNRIIMAAQAQATPPGQQPGDQSNGSGGRRQNSDFGDDEDTETEAPQAASGGGGNAPRGERGRSRQAGNGADAVRDANGAEPAEVKAAEETENAPDAVS